jgi:hypothetical protein
MCVDTLPDLGLSKAMTCTIHAFFGAFLCTLFAWSAHAQNPEKIGPEFPNVELQVSMQRQSEIKAFATDISSKPGIPPRFRFGKTNAIYEITWTFMERSDFGDMYKFTRIGPGLGREREVSQRQVIFTGRESVIWQDDELRVVVKPRPALED